MPFCPSCRSRIDAHAPCPHCQPRADRREPTIFLTERDLRILEGVLRAPQSSGFLRAAIGLKLHAARVVFASAISSDTVTLNSRVVYRLDGLKPEVRRLVAHGHEMTGDTVSLATPVGVALLGLTAGDETLVRLESGGFRSLAVLAVPWQPENPTAARNGAAVAAPPAGPPGTVVPFPFPPRPPDRGGGGPGPSAA